MKRLPQTLMVLSGLLFLASLTPFGSSIHYGIIKPVSAILFVVSYILIVLQKEVTLYDAEQRLLLAAAGVRSPANEPIARTGRAAQVKSACLIHAH